MVRKLATICCLLGVALPTYGLTAKPPPGPAPGELDWPWPQPDPQSWWDETRPDPGEAADPLGGRRVGRNERLPAIDNGYAPLLYRLWGLQPLQNQVLRAGEMIIEVAVRPATSARQTLIRVTVRRDGKAFVQARAGLGCCEPEIARRVGFDAEAPEGASQRLLALRDDPLWNSPREVRVDDGSGAADTLCVDGASYDLTLAVQGQARTVRRACDPTEIGQAADVLETVFGLALGHEPRIDVIYPGGASFAAPRAAYQTLISGGGRLKVAPHPRLSPPNFPPPRAEDGEEPTSP